MSPPCQVVVEVRFLDDDEVVVIGVESVDEKSVWAVFDLSTFN